MDDAEARPLDEIDLALIHALQLDARAPWTRVAAAIGVDAATVVRHWSALREEGLAWLTAWPTPERWASSTDLALVLAHPGASAEARAALVRRPWVLGVDETSAGLLLLVAASAGLPQLGERVRDLETEATVLRMDVAASVAAEDSTWRLRVLSAAQQRLLRSERPSVVEGARPPKPQAVAEIAETLDEDPRMPSATLGARLGVSEATARRAVDRATAAGLLRFGCDLAMPAAGFRRGAVLWARSADPEAAAARAARLPEVHRAVVVVGPAPLSVSVRARSLTALPAIERSWGPDVEIVDRWTVLRPIKRNGHELDAAGRSIARIPPRW
ncbi:MAG: AsnC family transcriptional regulator [Microbacterium sp.]|jgi:DNA-binding Lrp family transcriptional regulator|uniref:AsnC family transcriptional regulator n=1 Tax=Microbacterium sp. TaxID=51671 RepID=UPI00281FB613|nr:AsnC family transcriptional regulator [Microbacterium sp.]MDR2322633.1 AsnC family transcriptional regulator [Microbacterium sp.]